MTARVWLLAAILCAGSSACLAADPPSADVARLANALASLDNDAQLADKAALERFKAREALSQLQAARSRDRVHALVLADARVQAAQDAAQAELLLEQSAQLDRERDQIMLEASRRDAEAARREAELLRMQRQAQEEEAQRLAEAAQSNQLAAEQSAVELDAATAQASQAMKLAQARERETDLARREAELAAAVADDTPATLPPARQSGARTIYTLAGAGFASGSSTPTAAAQASLRLLAGKARGKRLRVSAHTDSQGSDAANLALSQKRADAVSRALQSAGFPAGRITAVGKGETDPATDNGSAAGRARNRRVEIVVE